jgi:hypothetical protein
MQMSIDLISRRQQVQILRQLPITRARMVRGIVANEACYGSTPFARSTSPRPTDAVDGLLSRRRWFESNSGRHHALAILSGPARSIRAGGAAAVHRCDCCVPHHFARLPEPVDAAASNTGALKA